MRTGRRGEGVKRQAETAGGDVVILGSGLAGLLCAIELADRGADVVLAAKASLVQSNTAMAQGGLAAVTAPRSGDPFKRHIEDTLGAGDGLCRPATVRSIVSDGAALVDRLVELGVVFDRGAGGLYHLAREGGHQEARVLHAKDATGRAVTAALLVAAGRRRRISLLEHAFASRLLTRDGAVCGVELITPVGTTAARARHVVLATGGAGQVFARTSNPAIATADGVALAWRAGASVVDMEFVQFHPTALAVPGAPACLISEAVRGAGAHLVSSDGRRFAFDFHPDGELATRDIVSRAICATVAAQEKDHVWLDMRPLGAEAIAVRFPTIVETLRRWGIDPLTEPIPVAPAAHYLMGGVHTDSIGRTDVSGLYAIGEAACTGLHGANRLASNSLLEAGAMAMRLAEHVAAGIDSGAGESAAADDCESLVDLPDGRNQFQLMMYELAGIARAAAGLARLVDYRAALMASDASEVASRFGVEGLETANIFLAGKLIARGAYARQESRGGHYRVDFPQRNDARFLKRFVQSRHGCHWVDVACDRPGPVKPESSKRPPVAALSGTAG